MSRKTTRRKRFTLASPWLLQTPGLHHSVASVPCPPAARSLLRHADATSGFNNGTARGDNRIRPLSFLMILQPCVSSWSCLISRFIQDLEVNS